jgi:hypothetical protein
MGDGGEKEESEDGFWGGDNEKRDRAAGGKNPGSGAWGLGAVLMVSTAALHLHCTWVGLREGRGWA